MSFLQKIIFKDIQDFDTDKISEYPLSIQDLIKLYDEKHIQKIEQKIDQKFFQPELKACDKIRRTKKDIKQNQTEKGKKLEQWHDFQAQDLSLENQQELSVLKYRKILNPKKAYKNQNDINHEQVQIGTIIGNKEEGSKGFLKKKEKRNKILDQFHLEDEKIGFTKKKFREIQDEKMKNSRNKKWIKLKRRKIQKQNLNYHPKDLGFN